MDWYQRSACSLLGFHFLKRSGVKLFLPVGKGIPTSCALIKWVIFKGRFISDPFRSRLQLNEIWLLQCKRPRVCSDSNRPSGLLVIQLLRLRLYPMRALCMGSRETSSDHKHVPFDKGACESGSKRASHQNPAACLGRDVNRANLETGAQTLFTT
ncbi:conserved hypothetical protein [Ricinus communis]|uniref:Uncharacterized protein n=1 Tax=Ricinus communis TaxID=3988 RepID=B9T620_RICCO|nr:conserved hypothetical protein [Ricinus communis]